MTLDARIQGHAQRLVAQLLGEARVARREATCRLAKRLADQVHAPPFNAMALVALGEAGPDKVPEARAQLEELVAEALTDRVFERLLPAKKKGG